MELKCLFSLRLGSLQQYFTYATNLTSKLNFYCGSSFQLASCNKCFNWWIKTRMIFPFCLNSTGNRGSFGTTDPTSWKQLDFSMLHACVVIHIISCLQHVCVSTKTIMHYIAALFFIRHSLLSSPSWIYSNFYLPNLHLILVLISLNLSLALLTTIPIVLCIPVLNFLLSGV